MTSKLYLCILTGISGSIVFCVALIACLKVLSQQQPHRPARLPATAVWRPTPSEELLLRPHGDWVTCRNQSSSIRCVLTDAVGSIEYDGSFAPFPASAVLSDDRLVPVTSDTLSPWVWSNHANRFVPIIQVEDGTVLTPDESAGDLRAYIERIQKVSSGLKQVPVYLEYHPAGTPYFNH
jgi:hypothetical protein